MRDKRRGSTGIKLSFVALTITLVAAGSLVAAGVIGRPTPETVASKTGMESTTVSVAETTQNQSATITITVKPPRELGAGAGQGMLSAIHFEIGDEVSQGTKLFDVNGETVWALLSDAPIYRDIAHKDKGADVKALQEFLFHEIGFKAATMGTVDQATVKAIRAWQRETGQKMTGVAEAARFVWLSEKFIISESKLALGEPVPAPGVVMFIETNEQGEVEIVPERPLEPGKYSLITFAEKIPVTLSGDQEWTFDKPQDLGRLIAMQKSLGVAETSDSANGLPKDIKIESRIELAEPIVGVAVPAASVFASDIGNGVCVWELRSSKTVQHTDVEILASVASGAVIVDPETPQGSLQGANLVLDPSNQIADAVCP